MPHYDAIISGCGPTGAVLANLLGAHGLKVCVIEKFTEVYDKPRAIVLDWEVMHALQWCGVAHALFPATRPHPGTNFLGLDGKIIKLFDPAPPPYPLGWPATSTFIQPELERMLRRAMELKPNVTLHCGHTLTGFADHGDRVEAHHAPTNQTNATQTITGDVFIGCDGANSPTREAIGSAWVDLGFDEWWVVVDAWQRCDTDLPKKTTQYCWPSRPTTLVHGPANLRRWELKLVGEERPEDFDDPDVLKAAMAPYVDVRCFDIWRHAAYRFAARTAGRWRKGRVFLAGDAVHTTPPFLGQGLCAGVRDAFNLAWKLIYAHRHGWSETLMDSYEAERRPHVSAVVEAAKEFGLIIGEMDMDRAQARDTHLRTELESGRMVTSRQGFIPDLKGGLVPDAPLAGTLMVQPRIATENGPTLMDDLLPMGFLYVTRGADAQGWLDQDNADWAALEGTRVVFAPEDTAQNDVVSMCETDATFSAWADRHEVEAVIVRPDRYVHAVIGSKSALETALRDLAQNLTD